MDSFHILTVACGTGEISVIQHGKSERMNCFLREMTFSNHMLAECGGQLTREWSVNYLIDYHTLIIAESCFCFLVNAAFPETVRDLLC